MSSNAADSNDTYELFMGALDVTNEALDKLRTKPVIKDILSLMEQHAEGTKFGVAVYEEDPDSPHDYFTVRVQNQSLQLDSRGKNAPQIDWKVSMDYLKKIEENPRAFVDNPLKLDLEWLKTRLQDAA